MSRHKRWINLSLKLALNSPVNTYRHGAVVVKGGRIIGSGVNKLKAGCLIHSCYELKGSHAEAVALSTLKPSDVKNAILYVGGWSKAGNVVFSKPCKYCLEYLKQYDLKAIYFSTPDGQYERLG